MAAGVTDVLSRRLEPPHAAGCPMPCIVTSDTSLPLRCNSGTSPSASETSLRLRSPVYGGTTPRASALEVAATAAQAAGSRLPWCAKCGAGAASRPNYLLIVHRCTSAHAAKSNPPAAACGAGAGSGAEGGGGGRCANPPRATAAAAAAAAAAGPPPPHATAAAAADAADIADPAGAAGSPPHSPTSVGPSVRIASV